MDPVSQGVLGAIAAQAITNSSDNKKDLAKAAFIGALAAMSPDLDVLISSSSDSLLSLEYHRQFTHSLLFIPLGALICSLIFYALLRNYWRISFKQIYFWSVSAYATHGLLDACTSYGTQLFWPITNYRVSWDIISIIDPLLTLPLLFLILIAAKTKKYCYCQWAVLWLSCYLIFGVLQHQRAIAAGMELIAERGHKVSRIEAKPSFANLLLWKIVYETEKNYYVDAVQLVLDKKIWPGEKISRLNIGDDLPWLNQQSQQAKDIERFRWFSSGFIALDPDNHYQVVDIRYSLLPNQITPLWGIRLSATAAGTEHATFYSQRRNPNIGISQLWNMIVE